MGRQVWTRDSLEERAIKHLPLACLCSARSTVLFPFLTTSIQPTFTKSSIMDRLGALEPPALTGESKQLYEDIKDYFEGNVKYENVLLRKEPLLTP